VAFQLACVGKSLKFRHAGGIGFGLFFWPKTTKPQHLAGGRISRAASVLGFVILFSVVSVFLGSVAHKLNLANQINQANVRLYDLAFR